MGETDQNKTGDGQTQTGDSGNATAGQGDQQPGQTSGQQGGQRDAQSSQAPATQAKAVALKLTPEQVSRLVKEGTLELSDELFSGAVKERMGQLTARAKAAERRLAEIVAAQEEAERKALEEQERFKDLYEKERAAREKEAAARKEDAIRSRFLIAAAKAGIVDPDVAFVVARSLPGFGSVAIDDEGRVTGVDELVEALVKEKPYLASTQDKKQSVGAASNPSQQEPPPPKTLAEAGDRLEQALRTGQL